MYEIFEKLIAAKGLTAYKVAKETKITTSTFSEWKNGNYVPKLDKLQKIADYLGVSVDYLMGTDKQIVDSDQINDLMLMDPTLIKLVKELTDKKYKIDDLKLAINMLEMARGKK